MKKLTLILCFILLGCTTESNNTPKTSAYPEGVGSETISESSELAPGVSDMINFEYNSSTLTTKAAAILRKQAEYFNSNPSENLLIEGHADERGTREYNLALGERRAYTVKQFLNNLGVAENRIKTISYGKERPMMTSSDEQALAANRRAVTIPDHLR